MSFRCIDESQDGHSNGSFKVGGGFRHGFRNRKAFTDDSYVKYVLVNTVHRGCAIAKSSSLSS